jgi:hypothetical protein
MSGLKRNKTIDSISGDTILIPPDLDLNTISRRNSQTSIVNLMQNRIAVDKTKFYGEYDRNSHFKTTPITMY